MFEVIRNAKSRCSIFALLKDKRQQTTDNDDCHFEHSEKSRKVPWPSSSARSLSSLGMTQKTDEQITMNVNADAEH